MTPTMQEKYITALEKLNEALEQRVTLYQTQMTSMNQEILALRESNEHYERVVGILESEKADLRAETADLKAEMREAREDRSHDR
jgi:chaperonin cofactor prefoldin